MAIPILGILDRSIFTATSGGTASFVVSAAVAGYQTPSAAGAVDGQQYAYAAQSSDLSQWEYGYGTWTAASSTLTRTVIGNSLGTTAAINFSAPPQVLMTVLGESIVPYSNGQANLALGTITANAKALNITGTWNNAAVTFDAPLFMNITNTASAAGSLLADFQVGGASRFSIQPFANGVQLNVGGTAGFIIKSSGNGTDAFRVDTASGQMIRQNDNDFFQPRYGIGWPYNTGADTRIFRDAAAGVLALTNGLTATGFRVYNTTDQNSGSGAAPTNYERGVFDWTTNANVLTIGTQKGGTGASRDVTFVSTSGNFNLQSPGSGASGITFANSAGVLVVQVGGGQINLQNTSGNNSAALMVSGGTQGFSLQPSMFFGFSSNTTNAGTGNWDTVLYRDAAVGVLALGNKSFPTTAMGLRVYNTTDQVSTNTAPTNYERAVFDWTTTGNTLTIGTQNGGTGVLRAVQAVGTWTFESGVIKIGGGSQPSVLTDIGAGQLQFTDGLGGDYGYLQANGFIQQRGAWVGWTTNSSSVPGTMGAILYNDWDTGTLAFAGGGAAAFRVYNTTDKLGKNGGGAPVNYERAVFDWTTTANVLTIGTQAGGTGTQRDIVFSNPALICATDSAHSSWYWSYAGNHFGGFVQGNPCVGANGAYLFGPNNQVEQNFFGTDVSISRAAAKIVQFGDGAFNPGNANGGWLASTATIAQGTNATNFAGLNITATWNSLATTGASGTGTTATLTFAAQKYAFPVGTTITVAGVTPAGYNGTFTVTASTTTSVSYANATTGAQTVAGTITTVFDAPLFINITNTASDPASRFLDFQVGGTTQFFVRKDGAIGFVGTTSSPNIWGGSGGLTIGNGGGGITIGQGSAVYIQDQLVPGLTANSHGYLTGDADYQIAIAGNTTATAFRVYNTRDNSVGAPTNYERAAFDWTTNANVLTIGTQKGGTGTSRSMAFATGSAEHARLDANGKFLFNGTVAQTVAVSLGSTVPTVQIQATDAAASFAMIRASANSSPGRIFLAKSRGAAVGTFAIVASADICGEFGFQGDDGTQFRMSAVIGCEVDGTPAAGNIPGRLVFKTFNSGAAAGSDPTEKMRIDNVGVVSINNATAASALRLYNTVDNVSAPTNFERGVFDWTTTANTLTIGTQNGGTGTGRNVSLVTAGNSMTFYQATGSPVTYSFQGYGPTLSVIGAGQTNVNIVGGTGANNGYMQMQDGFSFLWVAHNNFGINYLTLGLTSPTSPGLVLGTGNAITGSTTLNFSIASASGANVGGATFTDFASLSTGAGAPGLWNVATGFTGSAGASTFTVTIASPAVFTDTAHNFFVGQPILLSTTGALPTGLSTLTTYYIISAGFGANAFEVSTSYGGAAVNTSGTQSGTHTATPGGVVTISIASPGVVTLNNHGLVPGQIVQFQTTGALPTGLATATNYYVIAAGLSGNSFQVSTTLNGTAVATSGTQSGTQTIQVQGGTTQNPAYTVGAWGPCALTGAQNTPALQINQTWNTTATPVAAFKVSVTEVNVVEPGYIASFEQNGVSAFAVRRTNGGGVTYHVGVNAYGGGGNGLADGRTSWFQLAGTNNPILFNNPSGQSFQFQRQNVNPFASLGGGTGAASQCEFLLARNMYIGWGNSGFNELVGTPDTFLYRDAVAATLALSDGVTATGFRVYNTTDQIGTNTAPTNYERGVFDWTTSANTLTIGSQAGGTGAAREVRLTSSTGCSITSSGGAAAWIVVAASNTSQTIGPNGLVNQSNCPFAWSGSGAATNSVDTSISRVAAGVTGFYSGLAFSGGTIAGSFFQWGGQARVTSDFSVTSSTALTNVTGLTVNVSAGRTYAFTATLYCTDAAAGGVKAAIGGTCTATNIIYKGYTLDANTTKGSATATALGAAVGSTTTTSTTDICIEICGTITVNAAGTLTVEFAQNTSSATASVVKQGSTFIVFDMP